MSKRELIAQELGRLSESDLDRLLAFLQTLAEDHVEATVPMIAAQRTGQGLVVARGGRSLGQTLPFRTRLGCERYQLTPRPSLACPPA